MKISAEIKKRISCVDACRMYGVEINRKGFARCPFHNEKTASFKAYPGDRGFYCFGCGASGSVIDLAMKLFNESAGAACERLASDFRLDLPIGREMSAQEKLARNKEAWERQRREKELDKKRAELISERNEAIEAEKAVKILLLECAPAGPDDEWSEFFCNALAAKAEAFNRTDEAFEAIEKFDAARYAKA